MGTRRDTLSAFAIAAALALDSLNSTSVLVILDDIERSFSSTVAHSTSIVAIYLIGMGSLQPLAGRLGDRFGNRKLIFIGLIGFGASSVLAGLAPTMVWLMAARALQACFIAAVVPNAASALRYGAHERNTGKLFALAMGASGIASGLGPIFGGAVSQTLGWRWVFAFNLPLVIVLLPIVYRYIPAGTANYRSGGNLTRSVSNFVVLAAAFALLAFAVLQENSDPLLYVLAVVVGAVGIIASLLPSFMREGNPLKTLFAAQRVLGTSVVVTAAGNMAMFSLVLVAAFTLAQRPGVSDGQVGLILGAQVLGVGVTQLAGGWAADRFGLRLPGVIGRMVLLVGVSAFAIIGSDAALWLIAVSLFIGGMGMGISNTAIRLGAMDAAPVGRTGMAYGIYSTSRYAGSVGAVAAFAAIVGSGSLDSERFTVLLYVVVVAAAISGVAAFGLRPGKGSAVATASG